MGEGGGRVEGGSGGKRENGNCLSGFFSLPPSPFPLSPPHIPPSPLFPSLDGLISFKLHEQLHEGMLDGMGRPTGRRGMG